MSILVLIFVRKDVDSMIYFDKIPPGDQITLIRPKPGGLEPKCKY